MKIVRKLICLILTLMLLLSLAAPVSAAGTQMYGIGFVTATALRLRSEPTTTAQILDTASKDECIVIVSKSGSWYKVIYNLQEGYMHSSYLSVLTCENAELGNGVVTGDAVNLRSGPSTAYGVVDVVTRGEECYIIGLNQGWYKVIYGGRNCYIRSDYLELTECPYENKDSGNTPKYFRHGKAIGKGNGNGSGSGNANIGGSTSGATGSFTGADIVAEAEQYLGTPYVYGGASPSGFDCSGFVYYVLKSLGYSPYRTPADQYSHGSYVSKADLEPGDLVFFSSNSGRSITHVGIYVGGGEFIHSPNSRSTVSYSDLTTGYWSNTYYGARRISN